MQFGIIDSLLSDPLATLGMLALALPGRMLAMSAHEAAHGWVAEKCGDPTARRMGRVTLNPLRHLDPVGLLMMLVIGLGWAKPVPVNPRNFRNGRRDDLKVSLAGVTMNLILFLISFALCYGMIALALTKTAKWSVLLDGDTTAKMIWQGQAAIVKGKYAYPIASLLSFDTANLLIAPALGRAAGWLYEILMYSVMTNLMLAVFNLIPVPPLDGYHVLNDLLLKRSLFAGQKAMRIAGAALIVATVSGVLSDALGQVYYFVTNLMGGGVTALLSMLGIV